MTVWERVEKQARAGRGALSYTRIAVAGVELADAEGLEAVTMRQVAGRLEVGTMSLYRYVSRRDELIDLMADHVMAEALAPPPTGNWRRDLAEVARLSRRVTLRHRWLAGYAASTSGLGPNTLAMMESTLALLDGHGLTLPQTFELWSILQFFVQGYTLEESASHDAERRAGASVAELRARALSSLRPMLDSGRYPRAAKILLHLEQETDPDELFERHLRRLLEGLEKAFLQRP